jgi:2-methylisocitrate lyase-like PEP mutase family enzyme
MTTRLADFRKLHNPPSPLLLPNVWDAGSARLFESLGATAVATSSAAVAWALGYPDGYKLPTDVAIGLAANIARIVKVPVSIDMEDGYADQPAAVAETVLRLIDAGIVGINLEDGPRPADLLAAKIEKIKEETSKRGVSIFVNARTDVFLAGLAGEGQLVAETLRRADLYTKAGADGLFVPAIVKPAQISDVVAGIKVPLNVLAWEGLAPAAELSRLGVSRLSAGSGISQVLWKHAEDLAKAFLAGGKSETLAGQMPYGQLQKLF